MILVDTSVWIDHLRAGDGELTGLLEEGRVLMHPCVIGELSLGRLAGRAEILVLLRQLPQAVTATDEEVLTLIETRHLYGQGIGYVDAHLVAATMLTDGARLWTRDKRLAGVVRSMLTRGRGEPDRAAPLRRQAAREPAKICQANADFAPRLRTR